MASQAAINAALDLNTSMHLQNGDLIVARTQDCDPIAEHAKALQRSGMTGNSEMKHAASIPFVIVEKYCNDHHIEFSEFMQNKEHMRRVLNDPSLSHFRIWNGRI